MIIYIEDAILDNMIINTILFYFVFKTIKERVPWIRVLIAATIGTAFAIVLPVLSWAGILAFAVRMFIGAGLVFIVQNKSFKRWLLTYLLFLAYTFVFGGAVFGVLFMFNSSQGAMDVFNTPAGIPMGLIAGTVFSLFMVMRLLVKYLNARHSVSQHLMDLVIHHRGEKYKVTSYLDTGNKLTDPISDSPVVVISLPLFLKMFPEVSADKIVLNKLAGEDIEDGRYIPFTTVDSKPGKMFTFAPSEVEIVKGNKNKNSVHKNVRLGLSMRSFKDTVNYDALLNVKLV